MAPKRKASAKKAKTAPPAVPDYGKMTVAELRALCDTQSLGKTGSKAVLVKRLKEFDEEGDDAPPAPKKQSTIQKAISVMQAEVKKDAKADKKNKVVKKHKVDGFLSGEVYEDYDCMLNQTNIGHNNNKYYVIQVVVDGKTYRTWTRWGRVGEPGANLTLGPFSSADKAIAAFKKKFFDKTKNDWDNRAKFKSVAGKYTMIEVGEDDGDDQPIVPSSGKGKSYKKSALDGPTQQLMRMIFDNDMFREAMLAMEIDVKKMPLGKLSKAQIVKGFQVLDEIKAVLDKKTKGNLTEMSSRFYTVVPHDFGRRVPPVINTAEALRAKLDMLLTLTDIEIAQKLVKDRDERDAKKKKMEAEEENPLDKNYGMLNCKLRRITSKDKEYKVIEKYFESTAKGGWWNSAKNILDVWEMDRGEEEKRFAVHKSVGNRRLLWHGTKMAVVAAILKSGLRIMPHSGGRVGSGIYFASECSKSAGYVGPCNNVGVMFLNEVVLGTEKHIHSDDHTLKKAPQGYDSVVAVGTQEPDSKKDTSLQIGGHKISVPQASPVKRAAQSSFDQSEYLVYQESQVRMRYLLTIAF